MELAMTRNGRDPSVLVGKTAILLGVAVLWPVPVQAGLAEGKSGHRKQRILVENRTYSAQHLRCMGKRGQWGRWQTLLPGERHYLPKQSSRIVQVLTDGGKGGNVSLNSNNTYCFARLAVKGETQFVRDLRDRGQGTWPMPPEPPANSKSLKGFIDQCERQGIPYKLSLKQLAQECRRAQEAGTIPEHLRYLRGFTWFFGYVIDREHGDIWLLGIQDPTRPPIDLDCLATAVKAAYARQAPACSLDPHSNPQLQKSVVRGVPWTTRWAEIMIAADYTMKKVGQGRLNPHIPGLTSWFEMNLRNLRKRTGGSRSQTNRWWFKYEDRPRTLILDGTGDLVMLYQNPVILGTEKQVGGKFGTRTIAPEAHKFARDFTRHMIRIGQHYTSVGELLALFRLLDLMNHLCQVGKVGPREGRFWAVDYKHPYAGPPAALPTLTRSKQLKWTRGRTRYSGWSKVAGGVLMNLGLDGRQAKKEANRDLKKWILGR
jgi:hypothetical protein